MKCHAVSHLAGLVAFVACFAIGTTAGVGQESDVQTRNGNDTNPRAGLIAQMDANGDGKIERHEVDGSQWVRLSKLDGNGDGVIAGEELDRLRRQTGPAQRPATRRPGGAPAGFDVRSFQGSNGATIDYSLLTPEDIQPGSKLPLVLCLHGGRGATMAAKVLASPDSQKRHPCFVMAPACEPAAIWVVAGYGDDYSKTKSVESELMEAIEDVIATHAVDPNRIYITGQSKGGHGTWGMILAYPDRFAAAAPVCGPFHAPDVSAIAKLPIWVFHGNQDEGVPVEHSRRLVAALRDAGGSPGYTEFPGVGHSSWIPAYSMDFFWDWLFRQRRSDSGVPTAGNVQPQGPVASAQTSELLPTVEWVSHGFTTEQRDTIRAAFQDGVDQGAIPGGSLLLVHRGEVVFREAFGVDDLDTHHAFPVDARCRLASVTKPHSATVLAILADRGKLSLEDPIDKYLPEFSQIKVRGKGLASRRPTIAECLSHTSGYPGSQALTPDSLDFDWQNGTITGIVSALATTPLVNEPGTQNAYSWTGYMIAGRVAEIVTGKEYSALMRELLLDPVGATSTSYPSENTQRMPAAYERTPEGLRPFQGEPFGSVINPGGGLAGTLDGVGRFLLLHRNRGRVDGRQIVSADALTRMYVPHPVSKGREYGLGFNVLRQRPDGTAGRVMYIGGSGTLVAIDFDQDLIIVVLTQVGRQDIQWRRQLLRQIDRVFASASP